MNREFKVVVLGKHENVKYTYTGRFTDIVQAIVYYQQNGGRVVDVKERNVRLRTAKVSAWGAVGGEACKHRS